MATDDEPGLWVEILRAAAEDASLLRMRTGSSQYAIVGRCSHWARPHQSRWTAAGGFSVPLDYGDGEGYLGALPNLDWNVTLEFDPNQPGWICPPQSLTNGSAPCVSPFLRGPRGIYRPPFMPFDRARPSMPIGFPHTYARHL